jgi:hypothetical protein
MTSGPSGSDGAAVADGAIAPPAITVANVRLASSNRIGRLLGGEAGGRWERRSTCM